MTATSDPTMENVSLDDDHPPSASEQHNNGPPRVGSMVPSTTSDPDWKPTVHEILIMVTLSVISLMVSLDACIIVTSLGAIVADLDGTATQGFWVGTSYLLVNAVTMPLIAGVSDIFGRPACLIASLLFFTAGSLICALAHSMQVLLAGRAIQGVGGGGIVVLSLVIFTDIVPLRFRPKWYGTVLGAWAIGNCAGPVIGGAIAERTTWRWVFYLMFPLAGAGLVAVPLLLTLHAPAATARQRLARVDWAGAALFVAGATALLVAVSWGGAQYAWASAATLVPLIGGVAALGLTAAWEVWAAHEPFLKRALFSDRGSVATYLCGMFQGLLLYGELYYIPLYFLAVRGFTPLHTGLALFPALFTLVPASVAVGALVTRCNRYRWAIWLGWALSAVGSGLLLLFHLHTPRWQWAVSLVVVGLGHGAVLNAQNFATQACCPAGQEGAAAAMYGFLRQLGMALGVGVGGSAFQNALRAALRRRGLPGAAIARDAEAFVRDGLAPLADGDPAKDALRRAYREGLRGVFAVYLAVALLAGLLSLAIRHADLPAETRTLHRLRPMRRRGGGARSPDEEEAKAASSGGSSTPAEA
ncbi:major facilitator superfamily transporter [Xylariomycetidae sp. FL0641]|nr:major facilitator superfamily transporter [Xylariomycetidae sp. FL0641]